MKPADAIIASDVIPMFTMMSGTNKKIGAIQSGVGATAARTKASL